MNSKKTVEDILYSVSKCQGRFNQVVGFKPRIARHYMVKPTACTTLMGSLLLFSMASAKYQLMFYIVSGSFAIEAKSAIASELVFHTWMDNCFSVIFQERAVIDIGGAQEQTAVLR